MTPVLLEKRLGSHDRAVRPSQHLALLPRGSLRVRCQADEVVAAIVKIEPLPDLADESPAVVFGMPYDCVLNLNHLHYETREPSKKTVLCSPQRQAEEG